MPDLSPRPREVTPRPLAQLLDRLRDAVPSARLVGDPATTVTGVTHDSREVQAGDLYVARAGERTHGIDHVEAALEAGAVAVLTDPASAAAAAAAGARSVVVVDDVRSAMGPIAAWVYGDPAAELLLLGVTGTNGKTTTVYLLESGLRAAGRVTGLIGTIETLVAGGVLPSARTTPEATDLHALFAVMREREVDAVTMEVSSHALALGRVDGLTFDVAAFTNLSQDHLDFHADMADYFAAKAQLFTTEHARRGVVCIDDEWGRRLAAEATIPIVTTGRGADAGWRRTGDVDEGIAGGRTRLIDPDGNPHDLRCRLTGEVNLTNAALAYVTLVSAGIDPASAREGIAALRSIPGRMELIDAGQPFVVIVDYAHTPEAVTALLADARRLTDGPGQVIVVLGCGGDRDRAKRPAMGAAASVGADIALLTNDNPRSEDPQSILTAMIKGVKPGAEVVVEPDRRVAIGKAVGLAGSGDVVVIAGKGHELGQEIAGQVIPFDDRVVVREALIAAGGGAA
jgi:UDP-N-acetylmuramoyl-L-alanyl-D-glutamate--2,6-diaminopimelate ligase